MATEEYLLYKFVGSRFRNSDRREQSHIYKKIVDCFQGTQSIFLANESCEISDLSSNIYTSVDSCFIEVSRI